MYHHTTRPHEATRCPPSSSFTIEDLVAAVKDALTNKRNNANFSGGDVVSDNNQIFLNEADLAKRWWVSRKTLQRWRQTGDGIPHTKIGHRVIYAMADVLAFEAKAQRISTSERAK
jgi:hypothetical protein